MANQTNFAFSKSSPAAAADEVLVQWLTSAGDPTLISGPVKNTGGVDARTGTVESINLTSRGKLVTLNNASAIAVSLANPASMNDAWYCFLRKVGAGVPTLTPSAGTIDGFSSKSFTGSVLLFTDGANYSTIPIDNLPTLYGELGVEIDGGSSVPTTGSKHYLVVPFDCTIQSWTILADLSGSCQFTVKKSSYSGFPATSSIVASAPPSMSSALKATSSTLTGWTTSLSRGDVLEFNLDSVSTCKWLQLVLAVIKA